MNDTQLQNRIKFIKLRQTLSWENIIVMIILLPSMFILIHWSFKNAPLPDYVKDIIITLIQFVVAPVITTKGIGNHLMNSKDNRNIEYNKDSKDK